MRHGIGAETILYRPKESRLQNVFMLKFYDKVCSLNLNLNIANTVTIHLLQAFERHFKFEKDLCR
jgi:hypothetical protein